MMLMVTIMTILTIETRLLIMMMIVGDAVENYIADWDWGRGKGTWLDLLYLHILRKGEGSQ